MRAALALPPPSTPTNSSPDLVTVAGPWRMPSLMKAPTLLKLMTTRHCAAETRVPSGFHSKHTGASSKVAFNPNVSSLSLLSQAPHRNQGPRLMRMTS